MTHRQVVIWNLWFDDYLNFPGRSDYYLMQLTDEVRASGGGKRVGAKGLRIQFNRKQSDQTADGLRCEYTAAEMSEIISKQRTAKAIEETGGKPIRTVTELPEAFQRHIQAGQEMKRKRDEAKAKGEAFTWPKNKRSGG